MKKEHPQKLTTPPKTLTLAAIPPFSSPSLPQSCRQPLQDSGDAQVIRLARVRVYFAMKRLSGAAGFSGQSTPVASSRLIDAVAATLALAAVSLCFVTVLATKAAMAMPVLG
jgi:hypothetical protein